MKEVFIDVDGYEGLYQISNFGNVKSLFRIVPISNNAFRNVEEKYLTQSVLPKGYHQVVLCKNGSIKTYFVHRLVAIHFLQNELNKKEVNHIDGNKSNNLVQNLEWSTTSENALHAFKNGLRVAKKGISNSAVKLNDKAVAEIKSNYKSGNLSIRKLANVHNVSFTTVQKITSGKTWLHI